jgi:hypothetical protein
MIQLLNHDEIMYPVHGSKIVGKNVDESFEEYSDDLINKVNHYICIFIYLYLTELICY